MKNPTGPQEQPSRQQKGRWRRVLRRAVVGVAIVGILSSLAYCYAVHRGPKCVVYHLDTTPTAVTVPLGRIVLIRSEESVAAFKLIRLQSHMGFLNGARYEYWFQNDGSQDLMSSNVEHGFGSVREAYARGGIDDGNSQLNIKAGQLWVEWSQGNHIYPQGHWSGRERPHVTDIAISATDWNDIEDVISDSPDLIWIDQGGKITE